VWSLPDGAVVWKSSASVHSILHIKSEDGGDAAAAKGVVEAAHRYQPLWP